MLMLREIKSLTFATTTPLGESSLNVRISTETFLTLLKRKTVYILSCMTSFPNMDDIFPTNSALYFDGRS